MDRSYDEDITENRFFTTLQSKHKQLYQRATQQRCMICVPRTGVFTRISLSQTDFENHILQPVDEQLNTFRTLNKKDVTVTSIDITTGEGFKEQRKVHILFDETFYNDSEESFRVLCIDRLLEGGTNIIEDPVLTCLETYEDCCDFLWGNKHSKVSQKKVDDLTDQFCTSAQKADTLRQIIDATSTLFTKCIQIALKDVVLRTMQKNPGHMDNLKIAMETYIMNGIYTKVFKAVSQFYAVEDANLNKITRNLSELQVKDVGVRSEFTTNVPRARREMSTINKFSTPLGKMQCLRRTVLAITQQGFRGKINDSARAMSSDDLLPLLVFLVVKADIPNWLANLSYMQNFCLSNFACGEFGFYMASIEAAVEHVKSGAMSNSTMTSPITIDQSHFSLPSSSPSKSGSESLWQRLDSTEHDYVPAVDVLFQRVIEGNKEDVEKMLEASSTDYSWLINKMCHPLCSCDTCEQILASKRNDPRAVTASSRDNRGCTPMHAAAAYGHPEMISILMQRGGEVNVTDYHGSTPLHLACQRGHQNVSLLLLAKGASVGIEDNDGNRPLHLCCANGHEECVKALLYSSRPSQRVSINATNTRGDTALHLASRWGYDSIVSLLIDHGASVEARNRRQETPLMCSHNINISRTILYSTQNEMEHDAAAPYATSPPIASILSTADDDTLVTPLKVSVTRLTRVLQPANKEVEKLLRSVADGDILMMKHHLGWLSDSDFDDDDDEDSNVPLDTQLCHPLCQCSKCAMLQKRTTVSASGMSVNSHNQEGYTALHVAALHGHEAMVEVLLRRGANLNHKNSSSQQCTPLHLACQRNHPKIVSRLVQHGAKCNIRDARGNTPLHYCCLNGHLEPAQILIQHGANVNQPNERGNTPLHEAARFNFTSLVKLLLDRGQANPHCRNKAQQIPLRLTQKRSDVARMLKGAMRRDEDLESVTSTETNTSSGSSQTDPMESVHETVGSPHSQRNMAPFLPSPLSAPATGTDHDAVSRQPSVQDMFDYFGDADRSTIRALNHSIREFEPARQLRHVEIEDQHQENWNLYLRQQLEIQRFDRRKLRRAKTEDKSGPFFDMIKEGLHHTSHIENSAKNKSVIEPCREEIGEEFTYRRKDGEEKSVDHDSLSEPTELDTIVGDKKTDADGSDGVNALEQDPEPIMAIEGLSEQTMEGMIRDGAREVNDEAVSIPRSIPSCNDAALSTTGSELRLSEECSRMSHQAQEDINLSDSPADRDCSPSNVACGSEGTSTECSSYKIGDEDCWDIRTGGQTAFSDDGSDLSLAVTAHQEIQSEQTLVKCLGNKLTKEHPVMNGVCQDEE